MRRFDRLRKMAREMAAHHGHELGIFKPTGRMINNAGTVTFIMVPGTYGATTGTITIGYGSSTGTGTSTSTSASTSTCNIVSSTAIPGPHKALTDSKWLKAYCVHCGLECWLSEDVDPHKHFQSTGALVVYDQAVNQGVDKAMQMNDAAQNLGGKLPFPRRAKGIIFGVVLGEPCKSNPKLLTCGDLNG